MDSLEKAGHLLRLLGWIYLIFAIGITAAIAIPAVAVGASDELGFFALITIVAVAIPLLYLRTGSAIKRGAKWGKITGSIIAILSLLNLPLGTIFGALILFYLNEGWNENT